jgi:hypothetical protein
MKIVNSKLYETQLKSILIEMANIDFKSTKSFKLYLDTIILNMPTKVSKYKKSIYFDDENIKDIQHQGLTIPFFYDTINDTYVVLGIIRNTNFIL